MERLSEEDIIGTTSKQGLLEQLFQEEGTPMQDIALGGRSSHRPKTLPVVHFDDLPSSVSAETRYENCLPIDDVCLCCTSWIVVKLQSHLQPVSFWTA
jgi:hypothetical protein